jgi:hypothetical protein
MLEDLPSTGVLCHYIPTESLNEIVRFLLDLHELGGGLRGFGTPRNIFARRPRTTYPLMAANMIQDETTELNY